MEPNSHFDESQPGQKPAGKSSLVLMKERIMGYVVIVLIFVFFRFPLQAYPYNIISTECPQGFLLGFNYFCPGNGNGLRPPQSISRGFKTVVWFPQAWVGFG